MNFFARAKHSTGYMAHHDLERLVAFFDENDDGLVSRSATCRVKSEEAQRVWTLLPTESTNTRLLFYEVAVTELVWVALANPPTAK